MDRARAAAARRRFYAGMHAALVTCVAGAVVLVVLGAGSAGAGRFAELAGAVLLALAAYIVLAVIRISRGGDPER